MDDILKKAHIPPNATLAFQSARCRVYQWPQKLYDGTVGTFEKIIRIPAATVIAVVDGQILIQEQEQPHIEGSFLSLAGGHADSWDEALDQVAKRELLEETGLHSDDWRLVADLTQLHFTIFQHHLYLALDCKKMAEPRFDGGEKITTRLVNSSEFKEVMHDSRWRHVDITAYLNKADNFDKLVALINS